MKTYKYKHFRHEVPLSDKNDLTRLNWLNKLGGRGWLLHTESFFCSGVEFHCYAGDFVKETIE